MKITKKQEGTSMYVALEGRLDTVSAPELEKEIKDGLSSLTEITFDFANLEYISSAGLRVMLMVQRGIHYQGKMKIINANELVRQVFDVTGFSGIITIE